MAQKTTCGITFKLLRPTGDSVPHNSLQGARGAHLLRTLTLAAVLVACTHAPTAVSEFQRLRAQWLVEGEGVRVSSRSADYTALPAFRAIVALGPGVAPVIQEHLEATGCEEDFLLAYALVEINAWEESDIRAPTSDLGEQAFCKAVIAHSQREGGAPSAGVCLIEGPLHLVPRQLDQLHLGLSKSAVDRIMGAPSQSPMAGQYYYPTGGQCPLGAPAAQLSAPCGLVADFVVQDADDPSQMVETGKLDRCWWGAIVTGFSRVVGSGE